MLIRGTISANMLIKSRYSLNGNSNLESNIFRKDELRTGHNEMTLGAGDQKKVKVVNTSAYGLGPEHHILMEGITMQPSKRSAIAQKSRESNRASFSWNALAGSLLTKEEPLHYLKKTSEGYTNTKLEGCHKLQLDLHLQQWKPNQFHKADQ
ncbi:hypothetical protein V9T40_010410 [Parthenolecanium corni]|uniref:Uncharacterized protein n=1 Tax=Parthenolecanium corni TaxID=536013 RepID=A0AAN9TCN1_9HEMI